MSNLYRRGDSPYWWCWGHYADGERWSQSTKQRTRRAAEKAARAIERERLSEADSGYPPFALADAMDVLREHKRRKGCSGATLRMLAQKRARLEEHFGPECDVLTISLADTERYLDARRASMVVRLDKDGEQIEQPTSDHTIAKELGTLRQALRVLRKHDLYPGDPTLIWPDALRAVYTPRDRWLTVEEYKLLLGAVKPSRRKYVTLYCNTGLRLSELEQATRLGDDLLVRQTKGVKQDRVIPLSTDAKAVLDETPLPWPRWNSSNSNRDLRVACKAAEIERCSANDFRRTFCSWLCQAGVPELTIIKLMGHTSSEMVRRVYAQLAPATLTDAINRLPSVANT